MWGLFNKTFNQAIKQSKMPAQAFTSKAFATLSKKFGQSRQPNDGTALAAAREAVERGRLAKAEEERAHWRRVNERFEAAQAAGSIMGTFHCCICVSNFQRDITNDPDPRSSPFGDTCDACRAAGKQRPFEAAGGSVLEVLNAAAAAL